MTKISLKNQKINVSMNPLFFMTLSYEHFNLHDYLTKTWAKIYRAQASTFVCRETSSNLTKG